VGVARTKVYIAGTLGTHGTPGSSRRPAVLLQGVVMASLPPGCLDTGSWSICNATEYYLRTRGWRSLDVFSISIPGIWHALTGTEDFHVALVAVVAVGLLLLLTCIRPWARRSLSDGGGKFVRDSHVHQSLCSQGPGLWLAIVLLHRYIIYDCYQLQEYGVNVSSVSPPPHIKERGRGRGTTLFFLVHAPLRLYPCCHDSYKI